MGTMAANCKNTETSVRRRLLSSSSDKPLLIYMRIMGVPGIKDNRSYLHLCVPNSGFLSAASRGRTARPSDQRLPRRPRNSRAIWDSSANDGILRAWPAQRRCHDACVVTHHRSRTECHSASARALDQIIKRSIDIGFVLAGAARSCEEFSGLDSAFAISPSDFAKFIADETEKWPD